jgi:hypothetical protein
MPAFRSEPADDFHLAPGSLGSRMAPDTLDFGADGDLSEMVDVGAYAFGAEAIGTTWLTVSVLKRPAPPTGIRAVP